MSDGRKASLNSFGAHHYVFKGESIRPSLLTFQSQRCPRNARSGDND